MKTQRLCLMCVVVFLTATVLASVTPGSYKVNVSSTLNVRDAPNGNKIGMLSDGAIVQVTACEGDWARISLDDGRIGYVSGQYLVPFSLPAALPGPSYSTLGLSGLRHYAPFAILLFAILAFIGVRTNTMLLFHVSSFLWGAAELFMLGAGTDSALVWFCDPSDVGWIFTIINFFVAIAVLYFQYTLYREFVDCLFEGFWRKLLFGAFMVLGTVLFMGMFKGGDVVVLGSVSGGTWLFVLAFIAYMAVLLYLCRSFGVWMTFGFAVFAFGLVVSFLGMLSTLILGALIWAGLAAFAGSSEYKERYKLDDGTVVKGSGSDFYDVRTGEHYIRDSSDGRFYLDN